MAANSVSGSFRGIEVSFTHNGPHIVMSVLNTGKEGRRLRVMFQQQPLSGRVNWTSFQLTGLEQDVVVPPEVIHSHKLAFYVDDQEPIATYTEKILEELNQVRGKDISENHETTDEHQTSEASNVEQQDIEVKNNLDEIEQKLEENVTPEVESNTSVQPPMPQHTDPVSSEKTVSGEPDATNPEKDGPTKVESKTTDDNVKDTSEIDKASDNTAAQKTQDEELPKRKTQYIGQYIPDVNTELQFKIKVPSIPESASKKHQAAFIPPTTSTTSLTNGKKHGFFGQLSGVFGFKFPNKKKQFYIEKNQRLHDKFHADLERLETDYNSGCGIPLDDWDLKSLNEQQTAILLLNLMVNEVAEWKKEAEKTSDTKDTLAKTLETVEAELKQTLKQTRGINAPAPTLFPDRTAKTEQDLVHIQKECDSYLARFSDKLATLEQKHAEKVRVSVFKKFLLEFVRDRLFPDVAEFSSLKSVQSRLNWFLDLIDYELMPIEPGKTKFSPEFHEVKEKRSSEFESDTIVEVVSPGLQLKGGKRIVQNAVVIQAE